MPHDVIMPQMGESIAEGTITTWLKKVGEHVERDEALFEISTDKVDAEIPAPVAGVLLEIKAQEGETVPIDSVVAVIGEAGEATAPAPAKPAAEPAAVASPAPAPMAAAAPAPAPAPAPAAETSVEERRRVKSSPVVRKIAAEHGVDIAGLSGTGISGRVTKNDILAHLESHRGQAKPAAPSSSRGAPQRSTAAVMASGTPLPAMGEIPAAYRAHIYDGDRVEEMSNMRAKIAEHMVFSRRISAHVQTVFEVDFSHVDRLRKKHKQSWQERHGVNLTFTSFVMKATVDALKAFPILNASADGNQIIHHRDVNLGMAVALDWGLIVPVIHGADELNLLGLTRRLSDMGSRARDKKLKPDEIQRGTFTITNPGVFGNLFGLPIISQPQVAILGMGGIEKRPVVIDDAIAIRTRAYLSLSFDHRIIDGAVADQFMARIKDNIQKFDEAEL